MLEPTLNILVIAPTPALRAGVGAMLVDPTIRVVGSAATLPDLAATSAAVVVLTDDSLLETIGRGRHSDLGIVVLAADARTLARLQALSLRGWGLVGPEAGADELQAAVRAVAQGFVVLPARLSEQLLPARATPVSAQPLDEPLTARELEVLQLLAQGLANKQIARQLTISEHTVKFHVSAIYTKLGAASRTEAVSRGARRGLITL